MATSFDAGRTAEVFELERLDVQIGRQADRVIDRGQRQLCLVKQIFDVALRHVQIAGGRGQPPKAGGSIRTRRRAFRLNRPLQGLLELGFDVGLGDSAAPMP